MNPSGKDDAPFASASLAYDTRDVVEYPMRGSWIQASLNHYGYDQYINYNESAVDAREYLPIASWLSLCMRGAVNLAGGGDIPVYSHVFLGLSQRIRGDWNTKREGEDDGVGSLELRIPLWAPQIYTYSYAPSYVPMYYDVEIRHIRHVVCLRGGSVVSQSTPC